VTQSKSKQKVLIAPSILSADFANLEPEIKDVVKGGADWIHVDVMDGNFVPNLTIGPLVVKAIRPITKLPLDVHLMIDKPIRYIEDFHKAGSDQITIHTEADTPRQIKKTLRKIRSLGRKAGLSIRPKTPLKALLPYIGEIDLVLIMTVEPGFGGQSFMPGPVKKIEKLRKVFKGDIVVDGGINGTTGKICVKAGANVLVAGSAVFGKKSRAKAIREIRSGY
jgi:ribulose-phosphate 3-epimerase